MILYASYIRIRHFNFYVQKMGFSINIALYLYLFIPRNYDA